MLAIICLFMPGMVLDQLRERILHKNRRLKKILLDYLMSVLGLNYVMLFILFIFDGHTGNLFENLNGYVLFAWKYLTGALVLAVLEPFMEKYVQKKVEVSISFACQRQPFKYWRLVTGIYVTVLFGMNLVRVYDNNFWGDECYTINLAKMSISEIIQTTALSDVHPPLYYLFFKLVCSICGENSMIYHMVSLIPYTVILIISLTIVWNFFGKEVCIIFATFASLLPNAVTYNVEVRMYSLGGMFVLLSFLQLYCILINDKRRHYIFFTIFSLAAAYTHYYALVTVAFFYVALLVSVLMDHRRIKLIKVMVVYGITILGYLPWLGFVIKAFQRSQDFWFQSSDVSTMQDCMNYIFPTEYGGILLSVMAFGLVMVILYETGILAAGLSGEKKLSVAVSFKSIRKTNLSIWIIAGFISVIGTAAVGILISIFYRPLFLLRYMYPAIITAWLITAVCISRLKLKSLFSLIVLIITLVSVLPEYQKIYLDDKEDNTALRATLEATKSEIGRDDVILTNIRHVNWTISDYYYPGTEHQWIESGNFPELVEDKRYWIIVNWVLAEEMVKQMDGRDFGLQEIVDNGILGSDLNPVFIYKISDNDKLRKLFDELEEHGKE